MPALTREERKLIHEALYKLARKKVNETVEHLAKQLGNTTIQWSDESIEPEPTIIVERKAP